MKKITFFIFSWCFITLNAQTKQWTLENCIQHAIENNISIKQIELEKENVQIDLNTSKMSRLPNLDAGLNQNWSSGRGEGESGLYETQTRSNTGFSVGSSMPIFTGFRISNQIARNKLELEAARENLAKAKEDLALSITSFYLQVLFNKEIVRINEEQLILSKSQIERTKTLVEVGKVPLSQLYDIEAQVAKDEVSVVQAKNDLQVALLDLKQNMELETESSFDIVIPALNEVVSEYMSSIQPPQMVYNNAISIKPVVREQEYKIESAKRSVKIAQAGYLPKLDMNMGYSTSYYYNYDLSDNASFRSQLKDKSGQYVAFNLSIPIFSRFSVRNQVRSAKINISNQQLILENTKKTLYKEIHMAYINATSAQEKYKASSRAVKASAESFKYAEERYEIGKSSVFEFNEAKTKLVQSQSEEIQAKYDYIFRTKILDFYNGIPIVL